MYLPDVQSIYLGDDAVQEIYLGSDLVWPVGDLINTAVTGDFSVESVIDIDNIVPYGLYCFRWTAQDKYAKLTRVYDPYYVPDREVAVFIDAHVQNGIIRQSDAQKIRIVQAIPKSDVTELDGKEIYIQTGVTSWEEYTGTAYCFKDIYHNLYFNYGDFWQTPERILVLFNCDGGGADGNRIGGKHIYQTDSQIYLPAALREGYLDDTIRLYEQQYPYNFPTQAEWNAVKVDIIHLTPYE